MDWENLLSAYLVHLSPILPQIEGKRCSLIHHRYSQVAGYDWGPIDTKQLFTNLQKFNVFKLDIREHSQFASFQKICDLFPRTWIDEFTFRQM